MRKKRIKTFALVCLNFFVFIFLLLYPYIYIYIYISNIFKFFGLKPLKSICVNLSHIILKLVHQQFVLFGFLCSSAQFGQARFCGPMRNIFSSFLPWNQTMEISLFPFFSLLFHQSKYSLSVWYLVSNDTMFAISKSNKCMVFSR